MIAKYLERIADHAVNVAEWVAFQLQVAAICPTDIFCLTNGSIAVCS